MVAECAFWALCLDPRSCSGAGSLVISIRFACLILKHGFNVQHTFRGLVGAHVEMKMKMKINNSWDTRAAYVLLGLPDIHIGFELRIGAAGRTGSLLTGCTRGRQFLSIE